MKIEDAIEYVEALLDYEKWYAHSGNDEDFLKGIDKTSIEKILEQLKKQEKMIDLMVEELVEQFNCYEPCYLSVEANGIICDEQESCVKCIKQYFEKKAEDLIE